jgi:hypothetical protein
MMQFLLEIPFENRSQQKQDFVYFRLAWRVHEKSKVRGLNNKATQINAELL